MIGALALVVGAVSMLWFMNDPGATPPEAFYKSAALAVATFGMGVLGENVQVVAPAAAPVPRHTASREERARPACQVRGRDSHGRPTLHPQRHAELQLKAARVMGALRITMLSRFGIEIPITTDVELNRVRLADLIGFVEADDEEGARREFPVQPSP